MADVSAPSPQSPYPQTPQDARTQAKLAKAHAKALRPWYKKKRYWLLLIIVVVVVIIIAVVVSAGKAINKLATTKHTVVYTVTGDGTATVSYDTFQNGNAGNAQDTTVKLPWTKTITASGLFTIYDVNVTVDTGTTATCTLTVDGKQIASNTAHGQLASADCSGSNP